MDGDGCGGALLLLFLTAITAAFMASMALYVLAAVVALWLVTGLIGVVWRAVERRAEHSKPKV